MRTSRGDCDLVGHNVIFVPNPGVGPLPPVSNIIVNVKNPKNKWAEEAMKNIGEWRARLRSTYIRWALAINGLEVAAKRYSDPDWSATHKSFVVSSLRRSRGGSDPSDDIYVDTTIIAEWDGQTASQAHIKTMPMLSAFGVIDLYANLEDVVFDLYKIYLNHHPDRLLKGENFSGLRRLMRQAKADKTKQSAWDSAWTERLSSWQRSRTYDGLGKVFQAFCDQSGLKIPSIYQVSTVETWAESISILALVRNVLIHGVSVVSDELGNACMKPNSLTFDFKAGQPLVITLLHLQGVDLFCEQLLTAINLSLVELVVGPVGPSSRSPH